MKKSSSIRAYLMAGCLVGSSDYNRSRTITLMKTVLCLYNPPIVTLSGIPLGKETTAAPIMFDQLEYYTQHIHGMYVVLSYRICICVISEKLVM